MHEPGTDETNKSDVPDEKNRLRVLSFFSTEGDENK